MVLLKTRRLKKEMNRIVRALGWYSKGFVFDSRRGQTFFQLVLCAMEHREHISGQLHERLIALSIG